MKNTEQQFLKELDDKLWKAADKLLGLINTSSDISFTEPEYGGEQLREQFAQSDRVWAEIKPNLGGLGYER